MNSLPIPPVAIEGRRERRTREMRRRILHAAHALFIERGFDDVSIEDIADAADVARGTVFNHFVSKDALCTALGEMQLEVLEEAERDGKITGTPTEKIRTAMRLLGKHPGQSAANARRLIPRALAAMGPGEVPEHHKRMFEKLNRWVEEGQRSGEFRADLPPCAIAGFFLGLQFQATLVWAYGIAEGSLDEHITRSFTLGLEGVQGRSHA